MFITGVPLRVLVFSAALLGVTPALSQINPMIEDMMDKCSLKSELDSEVKIAACTDLIKFGMKVNKERGGNNGIGMAVGGYVHRAKFWSDLGQDDKTIKDYSAALELKRDPITLAARAGVYNSLNRHAEARADYEAALQLQPDLAVAKLGLELASAGEAIDRKRNGAAVATPAPTSGLALEVSFEACATSAGGSFQDRIRACTILLKRPYYPTEMRMGLLMARATLYNATDQFKEAISDCEQIIKIAPGYPFAFQLRGSALSGLGEFRRAIQDFDKAIALAPDDALKPLILHSRGVAYSDSGEFELAIADLTMALELNPGLVDSYGYRGFTYSKMSQYEEAVSDFRKALKNKQGLRTLKPDWLASVLSDAERGLKATEARGTTSTDIRLALVIGNSRYSHFNKLKNPNQDARDIAELLKGRGYQIVGNGGQPLIDATRQMLENALGELESKSRGADAAIFWYAGHGSSYLVNDKQRDNFLLPVDFKPSDITEISTAATSVERVKRSVMPASRLRMVAIDACRDTSAAEMDLRLKRGLIASARSRDLILIYSTSPGTLAEDGIGKNSPFAEAFISELHGQPDLPILRLIPRVSSRVKVLTKGSQAPELITAVTDESITLTN